MIDIESVLRNQQEDYNPTYFREGQHRDHTMIEAVKLTKLECKPIQISEVKLPLLS